MGDYFSVFQIGLADNATIISNPTPFDLKSEELKLSLFGDDSLETREMSKTNLISQERRITKHSVMNLKPIEKNKIKKKTKKILLQ